MSEQEAAGHSVEFFEPFRLQIVRLRFLLLLYTREGLQRTEALNNKIAVLAEERQVKLTELISAVEEQRKLFAATRRKR